MERTDIFLHFSKILYKLHIVFGDSIKVIHLKSKELETKRDAQGKLFFIADFSLDNDQSISFDVIRLLVQIIV